jgi:hypothetical protein
MKQIQITGHYPQALQLVPFWRIEGCKKGGYKEKAQIPEKEGIN